MPLGWTEAVLSDLHVSAIVRSSFYSKHRVLSGGPQQSILGPVLFFVYVSELIFLLKSHIFYANDGKLYGNALTCQQIIQDDLPTGLPPD